MTAALGAGRLLSQVVCAALVCKRFSKGHTGKWLRGMEHGVEQSTQRRVQGESEPLRVTKPPLCTGLSSCEGCFRWCVVCEKCRLLHRLRGEDGHLRKRRFTLQMDLFTSSQPYLFFSILQSAGDAPTTPKYTKEHRDLFFPASLPTPVLLSHTACHPLSTQDGQAKAFYEPLSKLNRPVASGFHDQTQHRRAASHSAAAMAFLPHTGTEAFDLTCESCFYCNLPKKTLEMMFRVEFVFVLFSTSAKLKLFFNILVCSYSLDQQGAPVDLHRSVT